MFSYSGLCNYLKVASIIFAFQGLFWALYGSFDPFGLYDSFFAKSFYQLPELPDDVEKAKRFLLVPFGATDLGYFILMYFITRYPLANRERWAYRALVWAFLSWLIVDTAMSLIYGAYFNVLIVNLPCVVLLGLPLLLLRSHFVES